MGMALLGVVLIVECLRRTHSPNTLLRLGHIRGESLANLDWLPNDENTLVDITSWRMDIDLQQEFRRSHAFSISAISAELIFRPESPSLVTLTLCLIADNSTRC